MPRIKIEVRDGGIVKLETEGFTGAACLMATERVKRALGDVVLKSEGRPEMFDQPDEDTDIEG